MAREGALWMGDMTEYMDEGFIINAFRSMGEDTVVNVKVMKNRYTGQNAGYCFVNFTSDGAALTAMHKLNGKMIPNTVPPIRFKLNHSSTRGSIGEKEFSLWVGDLSQDVDDYGLYKCFGARYNSIKTAKVIYDPNGTSKGFAFVRFVSEEEYKDALTHMNNFKGLGEKPIKVSYAVPKKQFPGATDSTTPYTQQTTSSTSVAQATTTPQQQTQQNYYDQSYWNNYANWGGYGQDSGQYYDMYSGGAGGNQEYEAPAAQQEKTNKDDFAPVEWNQPFNVEEANKKFIEESEQLWKTLETQKWSFCDSSVVTY